jgi:threonine/homoserine/homoserine lactone efflux protein
MNVWACLSCAAAGGIVTAVGMLYLIYLSHERFRKSHTKDGK